MNHTYHVYILASRSRNLHTCVTNGNRARLEQGRIGHALRFFLLVVIPNPVAVFANGGEGSAFPDRI